MAAGQYVYEISSNDTDKSSKGQLRKWWTQEMMLMEASNITESSDLPQGCTEHENIDEKRERLRCPEVSEARQRSMMLFGRD
ncbi:hypothetical protein Y032_0002g819 [Ancylostoma ceylanicum]|uniref:Uncharacterized protein n=1 Tax=Ancylostoma ceylanicum TaxID=53326 RepID=A0A016W1L8_9BILA|nr:hypothetical protein Y032_0002g819 [Ancylostoma ceylanicum]